MSESHLTASGGANAAQTALAVFARAGDVQQLGSHIQRLQRTCAVLQAGGIAQAVQWCQSNPMPEVVLVDIGASDRPLPALMELASYAGPTCRIVALGDTQDVDFYRQLLRAGIFDYLTHPVRLDQLAEVLSRADANAPLWQDGGARMGRTVALTGTGGGLGVSTLTAALGQWFSAVRRLPVALVDFDRRKSDLSLLLGQDADTGLAGVLAASEVDARLLQRVLKMTDEAAPAQAHRLQLLSQSPAKESALNEDRVLELGAALCQLFSLSLWDLPAHRPAGADEVLAHAEVRIVLCELSVQSARATRRLLAEIGDESAGQRLILVASGVRQAGHRVLAQAQFQDFVGRKVDMSLSHAGAGLAASLLKGPLSAEAVPVYANSVAQLGHLILGLPQQNRAAADVGGSGGGVLQRLLGAFQGRGTQARAASPSVARVNEPR